MRSRGLRRFLSIAGDCFLPVVRLSFGVSSRPLSVPADALSYLLPPPVSPALLGARRLSPPRHHPPATV